MPRPPYWLASLAATSPLVVVGAIAALIWAAATFAEGSARPWLIALAALLWVVLIASTLRAAGRLSDNHENRRWIMSLLDKLTDKAAFKAGLADLDRTVKSVDADALAAAVAAAVIGQGRVIGQISKGISRRLASRRRGKPVATVLVSGPTGTGKTEIAKGFAQHLYNGKMLRIDCGTLGSSEGDLAALLGSPQVYSGSSKGSLAEHLTKFPESVLLFDEIEKAVTSSDAPLAKVLLALLDEGRVQTRYDNSVVDATGCVIILTSNAKQKELADIAVKLKDAAPEELTRAVKDTLNGVFSPEFLGRIDLVTTVDPLSDESKAEIVLVHLVKIAGTYGDGLEVVGVDPGMLVEAIRRSRVLASYGTRELIRWIEGAVADDMIDLAAAKVKRIRVEFDDDGDRVKVVPA